MWVLTRIFSIASDILYVIGGLYRYRIKDPFFKVAETIGSFGLRKWGNKKLASGEGLTSKQKQETMRIAARFDKQQYDEVADYSKQKMESIVTNYWKGILLWCNALNLVSSFAAGNLTRAMIQLVCIGLGMFTEHHDAIHDFCSLLSPSGLVTKALMVGHLLCTYADINISWLKILTRGPLTTYSRLMTWTALTVTNKISSVGKASLLLMERPESAQFIKDYECERSKQKLYNMIIMAMSTLSVSYIASNIAHIVYGVPSLILIVSHIVKMSLAAEITTSFVKANAQYSILSKLVATLASCFLPSPLIVVKYGVITALLWWEVTIVRPIHLLAKYGYNWSHITPLLSKNIVDEYWVEQGLDVNKINHVSLDFPAPDRSTNEPKDWVKLYDWLDIPAYYTDVSKQAVAADMSDAMFCKAIHKRIAGIKKQPKMLSMITFWVYSLHQYSYDDHKIGDLREFVKRALSTSGSPGEFAKHTMLGDEWKTVEKNDWAVEEWMWIVNKTIKSISCGVDLPKEWRDYRMYKKVEILPLDEEGNVKITRLIQAANLLVRCVDSATFGYFNDLMVKHRFETGACLGSRIDHDLPAFAGLWDNRWIVVADFSDFDGHNHAMHLHAIEAARCLSILKGEGSLLDKLRHINWLRYKYIMHSDREVITPFNGVIKIIGQLASGDITTSDDNTARSALYVYLCLLYSEKAEFLNGESTGDDVRFTGDYDLNAVTFSTYMHNMADGFGWNLKECVFNEAFVKGGKPEMLGHSLESVLIGTTMSIKLTVPALCRPAHRLYTKMLQNAEASAGQSTRNMEITISKMISYINMLWGMPETCFLAWHIILSLARAPSTGTKDLPYTWRMAGRLPLTLSWSKIAAMSTSLDANQLDGWMLNPNRQQEQVDMIKYLATTHHLDFSSTARQVNIDESKPPLVEFNMKKIFKICKTKWVKDTRFQGYKRDLKKIMQEINSEVDPIREPVAQMNEICQHTDGRASLLGNIGLHLNYISCKGCSNYINRAGRYPIIIGAEGLIFPTSEESGDINGGLMRKLMKVVSAIRTASSSDAKEMEEHLKATLKGQIGSDDQKHITFTV